MKRKLAIPRVHMRFQTDLDFEVSGVELREVTRYSLFDGKPSQRWEAYVTPQRVDNVAQPVSNITASNSAARRLLKAAYIAELLANRTAE